MNAETKREQGRERDRARAESDLFSIHNCSRMQVDVDTVLVFTDFKMIHLQQYRD